MAKTTVVQEAISSEGASSLVVRSTREYGKFQVALGNRGVNQRHVDALIAAIQRKNLLAENPILVTPDWVVLNGQHRLRAAEALELPIYYIVTSRMDVEDVAETQGLTMGWRGEDHLAFYCAQGNPNYLRLRAFWAEFPWLELRAAGDLCHWADPRMPVGSRGGVSTRTGGFGRGVYVCNDLPFARMVTSVLLDLRPYYPHFAHRTFVAAVSNLCANAEYDHGRMLHKLQVYPGRLQPSLRSAQYIEQLNTIYNFHVMGQNYVLLRRITSKHPHYRVDRQQEMAAYD